MIRLHLLLLTLALVGCETRPKNHGKAVKDTPVEELQPFSPLPPRASLRLDPKRVALGRRLFGDPILSGDGAVSCLSCHEREKGLSNGARVAELPVRDAGVVNVPSLYNIAYNFRYNWDGRFSTLEGQLDALIEKRGVMSSSWVEVVERLKGREDYVQQFRQAFPEGVTSESVRTSLVDYMTSLTTPGARFDQWLQGDEKALNEEERKGYRLFNSYGCSSCHQGRNIGGNMVQQFGIIQEGIIAEYFKKRGGDIRPADRGYGNFTGQKEDDYFFRVPSLRNVAETPPYFHDGGAATLGEAIRVMGRVQLGRDFEPWELRQIEAFLRTLTGDLNDEALR